MFSKRLIWVIRAELRSSMNTSKWMGSPGSNVNLSLKNSHCTKVCFRVSANALCHFKQNLRPPVYRFPPCTQSRFGRRFGPWTQTRSLGFGDVNLLLP